ncbi:MAG: PqqD family protein [Planctomycetes bacterium]|nr:PqqD family protein [Planctomycetota bacterium]
MTAMPTVLEKRPFRDFTEQLHSVPVRNALARLVRERSDERKEVYAVRQKYSGIARLLKGVLKLRDEKMYELSGIGLRIFRALDGKKNFVSLIDELKDEHQLTFYEARGLMLAYMQMLMERGLVVIVGLKEDGAAAAPEAGTPPPPAAEGGQ